MKLLVAATMMGMPMFQSEMYAGGIKVTTNKGGDSLKGQYPHLAPRHYSHEASAAWNVEIGILSLMINADSDEACISIYKDDTLLMEETRPVFEGDILTYDLSAYGDGDYQIVITGLGNDTLYGNF